MKKIFTFLLATAALMIVSAAAMAQGGLAPFAGSTHTYTVAAADANNTLAWAVSPATGFTVNSGAASQQVNITWSTAGTYTLTFTETDAATLCATVKTATVVVSANTFDVSTTDPAATCNTADGQVDYSGITATTSVTFTVNMATGVSTFNPNWNFAFTLSSVSGATLSNVKVGGTSVTASSGTYTSPNQSSTSGTGSVSITLDAEAGIFDIQDVVLSITSASELSYNTPDVDSGDWSATQTINAIPNTSTITTD